MKRFILSALAAVAMIGAFLVPAQAAGVDVNATPTGLAVRGYDVVAYFTEGKPVAGDWQITAEHGGATYRFASEANRDAFKADPARYAPQFGGYCAFGAAMGFKFDGDPEVFKIVDDKLYLNLSRPVAERWNKDVPGHIKTANEKWVQIKDKAPSDLQQ